MSDRRDPKETIKPLVNATDFGHLDLYDINTDKWINPSGLMAMAEMFEFQGFDPKAFLEVLKAKARILNPTNPQAELKALFDAFSTFYAMRGTRAFDGKVLSRMEEKGQRAIVELIKKWSILANRPGKPTEISVTRILNLIPRQIMYCLNKADQMGKLRKPVEFRAFVNKRTGMSYQMLPGMSFPGFVAVIPKSWNNLFALHLDWQMEHDLVINSQGHAWNPASVIAYAKIAWNSSPWDNDFRMECMTLLGFKNDIDVDIDIDDLFETFVEDKFDKFYPDAADDFRNQYQLGLTRASESLHTGVAIGKTGDSADSMISKYKGSRARSVKKSIGLASVDEGLQEIKRDGTKDSALFDEDDTNEEDYINPRRRAVSQINARDVNDNSRRGGNVNRGKQEVDRKGKR